MGLFSTKKTYVSSVIYNMAGDLSERVSYLKTTLISSLIIPGSMGMGSTIRDSYLNGPGMKARQFFRWAENHYDLIGVPTGSLGGAGNMDYAVIGGEIPPTIGTTVQVQVAEVGVADFSYWAEQWMFDNHVDLIDTDWSADINETSGDIEITFEDTTTDSFTPVGFDKDKVFLYVIYSETSGASSEAPDVGAPVIQTPGDALPDTTGFSMLSDDVTMEGSDEREIVVWEKTVYTGQDPNPLVDRLLSLKTTLTINTLTDPSLVVLEQSYQVTTQVIVNDDVSQARMFIYEIGSGNAVLDALVFAETSEGEYLPFIPVRIDNQFLSESYHPDEYALAKKAYKKSTGGAKFDELVDKIYDNEDLEEIDYAYVMQGVSLNILDPAGKEYLYRFFDKLRLSQTNTNAEYLLWQTAREDQEAAASDYTAWKQAQSDPMDILFGTAAPSLPTGQTKGANSVRIKSNGTGTLVTNVDMTITWQFINRTTGAGILDPDHEAGDYWLTPGVSVTPVTDTISPAGGVILNIVRGSDDVFEIHHQIDDDNWETLQVVGAEHRNLIYKKKAVEIKASEAFEDEDESGFLVPLHYATLREMPLTHSTQLCTNCTYIVFNCYKIVKQKWYQTTLFKIFVFIVIIAITVATAGTSAPMVGILGSALSVGTAIGLTGIMAVIAGAVINALVAMVLMRLIMMGATKIFGEKWGAIIGMVVSLVTLQVGTGLMNGASLASSWSSLMSADNILRLTQAVGGGVAGYIQGAANETLAKTQDMLRDYAKESAELSQKFADEFGYGRAVIDPLSLTNSNIGNSMETEFQFLSRTLMTGTDIAEMSKDMLTNFAEYTLALKPDQGMGG